MNSYEFKSMGRQAPARRNPFDDHNSVASRLAKNANPRRPIIGGGASLDGTIHRCSQFGLTTMSFSTGRSTFVV